MIAYLRPFSPMGINYFAIVAGFLEFLLAATAGFMTLFQRYANSPLGEAFAYYIPWLEVWANRFILMIFAWSGLLVFGKVAALVVERIERKQDRKAAREEELANISDALGLTPERGLLASPEVPDPELAAAAPPELLRPVYRSDTEDVHEM
jgi:hypothetical protein